MIWGEEDPWEKIEWGRGLAGYHSVEEFVSLPGVGHCPQVRARCYDHLPLWLCGLARCCKWNAACKLPCAVLHSLWARYARE